jgi:hypothetical protein
VLQHVLVAEPDRRLVFTPTQEGGYTFAGVGTLGKILNGAVGTGWRPQRDSNPRYRRERPAS